MSNVQRAREAMLSRDLTAMLISELDNVQWLTGFTGSFGMVLLMEGGGVFITDSRYAIQAPEQITDLEIATFASPVTSVAFLASKVRELGISRLGFETATSYASFESWHQALPEVELVPVKDLLTPLRMIKTEAEVEAIRRACKLADACFDHVRRMLRPGMSEYDIGLDIEFFFRRNGAGIAFPPIVASGPNSARPHGRATERKLEPGDFLTLDFGATVDGYNSDITRTVVIGEPSERQRSIYNRVLEAQVASLEAIKPGAEGSEIDRKAREILDRDDLAKYFGHGLGHGLGKSVHDAGRLGQGARQPIEPGQVWTVEPGVYIEGFGGVRIEDDVLVTQTGNEVLTASTKELLAF